MFSAIAFEIGLDIATALSIVAASITYMRAQARSRLEDRRLTEKRLAQQRCDHAMQVARETVFTAVKLAEELALTGIGQMQKWNSINDKTDFREISKWVDEFLLKYSESTEMVALVRFREVKTKLDILLSDNQQNSSNHTAAFDKIWDDAREKIGSNAKLVKKMASGFKNLASKNELPDNLDPEIIAAEMVANAFLTDNRLDQRIISLHSICLDTYKAIYNELLKINNSSNYSGTRD